MNDQTLISRIVQLEHSVRRWRATFVSAVALMILAALMGASNIPDMIASKTFKVMDASGRTRANLTTRPDGVVVLTLADQNGEVHLELKTSPAGNPMITMHNKDGELIFRVP